ncbi:DNA-directed RNA polymerase subunit alpha C-terminal domain-containing protein [Paraburkholderia caribensis]|uniref:DNA-directed RNA polymerase subunit alpha C-terminal domain-containing protein n=1 Tax=Paraburkholderia caribensis TaxID=75105 RepID=UPI00286364EC|nr:DNA-directed RNA polymerase subunit alpha C-terminal domain-containing protein [Paraburkholderia caribensis]MDR6384958.1 DNA-directed RNA polymerase alpha subunit [Paraburkholderia caribensis]
MRIVIEGTDELTELLRARQTIEALLRPLIAFDARLASRGVAPADDAVVLVNDLPLPLRVRNALAAGNIVTVDDLAHCTPAKLRALPRIGRWSVLEIEDALATVGRTLELDFSRIF